MREEEKDFVAELEDVSVDIEKARKLIGLFVSENEGRIPKKAREQFQLPEGDLTPYNFRRTFILAEVALDLLWNIEKKMSTIIDQAFSEKHEVLMKVLRGDN